MPLHDRRGYSGTPPSSRVPRCRGGGGVGVLDRESSSATPSTLRPPPPTLLLSYRRHAGVEEGLGIRVELEVEALRLIDEAFEVVWDGARRRVPDRALEARVLERKARRLREPERGREPGHGLVDAFQQTEPERRVERPARRVERRARWAPRAKAAPRGEHARLARLDAVAARRNAAQPPLEGEGAAARRVEAPVPRRDRLRLGRRAARAGRPLARVLELGHDARARLTQQHEQCDVGIAAEQRRRVGGGQVPGV
mmetsp:Transcript_971/g.3859  ORF Transcript_971/g.3859 Transcript_971/m.3859 type:complete len:255 (-) Transcript_971:440-1204(-)